jgi:hypothetical protein
VAEQACEPYYTATATAWLGVIQSEHRPLAALEAIPALLDYTGLTGDHVILVHRSRDLLSPLATLGRYRDVAILDGATTVVSLRPALAAHAVTTARAALGHDAYAQLTAVGRNLSVSELATFLGRLWVEIDEAGPDRTTPGSWG